MREIMITNTEFSRHFNHYLSDELEKRCGTCQTCVKADVCSIAKQFDYILERAEIMGTKDFEVEVTCRHWVRCN